MVVNVSIRSVRRIQGLNQPRDEERVEVVGAISFVGKQAAWPVGSMQLRTVSEIMLTSKTPNRGISGSVSSPSILGNTVLLTPVFLGTTGTRVASIKVPGSVAPTGTVFAAFTAYGY